ncbi:unnamed protein product [Mucor hiemalis]
MEDVLSPTHAYFDFDFSEFIDKNFDMSNDILNSPNEAKLATTLINDLNARHEEPTFAETKNYTHEDPDCYPLWSCIEDLVDKAPPTLSCIDDFIKDPQSDLVQLVQKSHTERILFENLITHSLVEPKPVTPLDVLQKQQQEHIQQFDHQLQQPQQFEVQHRHQPHPLHSRQNFEPHLPHQTIPQHPLDGTTQHMQNSPLEHQLYLQQIQERQKQQTLALPTQQKKKKNSASAGQKRVSKSSSYSSNNSSYTHSDSVNAQLLRELIRQAGRSNANRKGSLDSSSSSVTSSSSSLAYPPPVVDYLKDTSYLFNNGNYHHRNIIKPTKPIHNPQKNTGLPSNRMKIRHHSMGRPSMYSSDISQAQLLEIQAISRAQQDFIRTREQQEAEKELLSKQKKQLGI